MPIRWLRRISGVGMTNGGWLMYMTSFLSGAALLVFFAGREPEWAAPLILTILGVLSAAVPRPTPRTERMHGRIRARGGARRLGVLAAILGMFLLLRALGVM
ncbi:MAG TPA: hypothetical protein VF006_30090 [Longimicrobium sp.]